METYQRATPPATVQPALSTGYCSTTPPRAAVHLALHRLLFNQPSTGSTCSSSPPRGHVHPRPTGSIDRGPVHPAATPRGPIHPTPPTTLTVHQGKEAAGFNRLQLAAIAKHSLGFSNVPSAIARVQLEPNASHPRAYGMRETCIARPPTTHRNRELLDIFLALASTMGFSVMDGPKNVMQLRLRPAQDENPFSVLIFWHRSRSPPHL